MDITLIKAAAIRALRTFLQTLIPALGAGALTELNYVQAASIAGAAALISFLQGILGGLPEGTVAIAIPTAEEYGAPLNWDDEVGSADLKSLGGE